jgi:tyrosyl-tRNA synthetase
LRGAEINAAKKLLADAVTILCHGREAADAARETATRTFEEGAIASGLPAVRIKAGRLSAGVPIMDLLVEAGLAGSKGEARRLIGGGGARVNGMPVGDETACVGVDDVREGVIRLSAGRKRHALAHVD